MHLKLAFSFGFTVNLSTFFMTSDTIVDKSLSVVALEKYLSFAKIFKKDLKNRYFYDKLIKEYYNYACIGRIILRPQHERE